VTVEGVVRQADEAGLRLVRFLWCGNDGTVRAKASTLPGLASRIESGIGLTVAMQAMNEIPHRTPSQTRQWPTEKRLIHGERKTT